MYLYVHHGEVKTIHLYVNLEWHNNDVNDKQIKVNVSENWIFTHELIPHTEVHLETPGNLCVTGGMLPHL